MDENNVLAKQLAAQYFAFSGGDGEMARCGVERPIRFESTDSFAAFTPDRRVSPWGGMLPTNLNR